MVINGELQELYWPSSDGRGGFNIYRGDYYFSGPYPTRAEAQAKADKLQARYEKKWLEWKAERAKAAAIHRERFPEMYLNR